MAATDAAPPAGQSKVLSPDCSSQFLGLAQLGSNWVLHPPLTNHHGGVCVGGLSLSGTRGGISPTASNKALRIKKGYQLPVTLSCWVLQGSTSGSCPRIYG